MLDAALIPVHGTNLHYLALKIARICQYCDCRRPELTICHRLTQVRGCPGSLASSSMDGMDDPQAWPNTLTGIPIASQALSNALIGMHGVSGPSA